MSSHAAPPVVILCGFMGTGKTDVGRRVADRLGVRFIDTDAEIEAREGSPIPAIFDTGGETAFRELESQLCRDLDVTGGAVVATGGGMIVDDANFEALRSLGTMVLLEAHADAIVNRISSAAERPMLAGRDHRERVEELLNERRRAYHRISLRFDTTRRTPDEMAIEITESLQHDDAIIHMRVGTRPVPGHAPQPGEDGLCRVIAASGSLARLGDWLQKLGLSRSVYLLTPPHLDAQVGARLRAGLDERSIAVTTIDVKDGDSEKTLAQAEHLLLRLAQSGATRDSVVVAAGGGVTGDVAGFVAATYMRGVPLVQVPTTLLAQVDASIGGKVGVNHPLAKNLLGSVHQPHLVLIDPDLLSTLPEREIANGMAEVVKTAIIGAPELFERLGNASPADLHDPAFAGGCVAECARVKAAIVEEDPYERDRRRVLNLGHTVGHALESVGGYTLKHGEAVALGLLAAVRLAVVRGKASDQFLAQTRSIIEACSLPVQSPEFDDRALRDALSLDKKQRSHGLTFVLPRSPGCVEIVDDVTHDELLSSMGD